MDKKCMPEVCVKIHYTCFWHYFIFTDKNMGHRTKRILRIERKEYQTY